MKLERSDQKEEEHENLAFVLITIQFYILLLFLLFPWDIKKEDIFKCRKEEENKKADAY